MHEPDINLRCVQRVCGGIEVRHDGARARAESQTQHDQEGDGTDFDYAQVAGLSNELREKLVRVRPCDLGQASRISGMTPAAIALLLIHAKKQRRQSA